MTKTGDKLRFVPLSRKKKGCPLSVWLSREGGREKKDGPSAPDLQSARRRRGVQDFHTMFEQVPGVNQGDPLSLPAAQRVDPASGGPRPSMAASFCVCPPLLLPLFSSAGNTQTKKRNRLNYDNLEKLVYLHENWPLVREWNMKAILKD